MNDLYFCGDIHGEYKKLVWTICIEKKIKDASIIILGDFGVGFTKDLDILYKKSEQKLEKNNITLYAIRGNHDDPKYFEDLSKDYPRLKFLQDHKIYNICDRSIYTIGGAHSTDANTNPECTTISDRKLENERRLRKGKMPIWWENECVEKKYNDLPRRVDIIISHTAPISFEPVAIKTSEISTNQFEKIIEERKYLQYILYEIRADYWFYGHFHRSYTGTFNQLLYRCLKEFELFPAPEKKELNPQGELK
jgi:DNA repair exonuclease SbcCD nuclease subunit